MEFPLTLMTTGHQAAQPHRTRQFKRIIHFRKVQDIKEASWQFPVKITF